ncbi:MAG: dNTP triphosphohydrolase [Phycisphaerae bacterium]|nr:dNTP triphosphohydrolase [Phycisphaerae bacterium]NIP52459.1 dNTP triphosphohydrolase [Phycisphaerae bacterium]NIS50262.1 dNTP triphosphohydrolase [Phycisphaerae bacterium]NIU07862.1 dNTP triphosphohydrolase [Phycisphaerae bacterium]NIU55532.1 dNTP triphosphohydrolase [Phycisphaerae bacterium]
MPEKLAGYAVTESISRGRNFPEKPHPYRSAFERDRDRIIHSSAFRRLEGKTQVFTPGLDDHYRTRLTHSIEVAQIGRTIAKGLGLNITLTEAICLAHDLGHPPFGHAGEKALDELTADIGGFEHNRQTVRVVELLEHPYPDFPGLNLMYETHLGLAKHETPYDKPQGPSRPCSLEGQVVGIADRIAYNCHDLEDGMRAGLIDSGQLETIEIFTEARSRLIERAIEDKTILRTRTAKNIIDKLVGDCIDTSKATIAKANLKTVEDVYAQSENLICLSANNEARLAELEQFLFTNFYQHKSLLQTSDKVKDWLGRLLERLCQKPDLMPGYFQKLAEKEGLKRTVCDYVAGMTDRFCLKTLEEI